MISITTEFILDSQDYSGRTLRELLNGDLKVKMNGRRPLAISRMVNAFDQVSCERNLQITSKMPTVECNHFDDVPFYEY